MSTITYLKLNSAMPALRALTLMPFSPETTDKLARIRRWAEKRVEDYADVVAKLTNFHAELDADGEKVEDYEEVQGPKGIQRKYQKGSWVPRDKALWREDAKKLDALEINTNGVLITAADCLTLRAKKDSEDPGVTAALKVGLGDFYDWGEEQDEPNVGMLAFADRFAGTPTGPALVSGDGKCKHCDDAGCAACSAETLAPDGRDDGSPIDPPTDAAPGEVAD